MFFKSNRLSFSLLTFVLGFLLFPTYAFANVSLPMFAGNSIIMVLVLIPLVFFEANIIIKYLNIRYYNAVEIMGITNIISTIIGIPIVYLIQSGLRILYEKIFYVHYSYTEDHQIESVSVRSDYNMPEFIQTLLKATIGSKNFEWIHSVNFIVDSQVLEPLWYMATVFAFSTFLLLLVTLFLEYLIVCYMLRFNDTQNIWKATSRANIYSYFLFVLTASILLPIISFYL